MKKISIREFVNEDELKFQMYAMKYSSYMKLIQNYNEFDILYKWNYDNSKKIKKFKKDLNKKEYQDPYIQDIINKNITYLTNLRPLVSEKIILEEFENIKKDMINKLEQDLIKEPGNKRYQNLIYEIENAVLDNEINKDKFGAMLLLIVKNMASMTGFSGYSDNWKTDFFSNAIEKNLLYINNFDERLLSKRTGNRSKAFAYVTQICFNAFVNVINERKKDSKMVRKAISSASTTITGVKDTQIKDAHDLNEVYEIIKPIDSYYMVDTTGEMSEFNNSCITETPKDWKKFIEYWYYKINENNKSHLHNIDMDREIEYLNKITDEKDKDKDFYNYIDELPYEIIDMDYVDSLYIVKRESDKITTDVLNIITNYDLNIVILNLSDEVKLNHIRYNKPELPNEIINTDPLYPDMDPEDDLAKLELEVLDDMVDEWGL